MVATGRCPDRDTEKKRERERDRERKRERERELEGGFKLYRYIHKCNTYIHSLFSSSP